MTEILPLNNPRLQFIQEKITDIRTALFFSQNSGILKMPANIVTALKVDEDGQIWFYVNRPKPYINAFEKEFPARLDFYRKGKGYFLQVVGKAFILETEKINDNLIDETQQTEKDVILIKVKIADVKYFETFCDKKQNLFTAVAKKLYNWLFAVNTDFKPYHFASDAAIN